MLTRSLQRIFDPVIFDGIHPNSVEKNIVKKITICSTFFDKLMRKLSRRDYPSNPPSNNPLPLTRGRGLLVSFYKKKVTTRYSRED